MERGIEGYSFAGFQYQPDNIQNANVSLPYSGLMAAALPVVFLYVSRHSRGRRWFYYHECPWMTVVEIPLRGVLGVEIDNLQIHAEPGTAVILPEGEENRIFSVTAPLEKIAVGMRGNLVRPLLHELFGGGNMITGIDPVRAEMLFSKMYELIVRRDLSLVSEISGLGYQLLYTLAENHKRDLPPALIRALHIMEIGCGKRLSIRDVATNAGLTPVQLNQLIRKHFGMTAKGYFMERRFEKACSLLRNDLSLIKNIAASVGYPDFRVFSREFRKRFGLTPEGYREKYAGKDSVSADSNR